MFLIFRDDGLAIGFDDFFDPIFELGIVGMIDVALGDEHNIAVQP